MHTTPSTLNPTASPEGAGRAGLVRLGVDVWQRFVESHPGATIFHHRDWLELLVEQYRLRLHILGLTSNGDVRAALPFIETRTLTGARKLISLPFTDYSRALALDHAATAALRAACAQHPFAPYQRVFLRTDSLLGGFRSASTWVRHELAIDRPYDQISRQFGPSLRRNLRRAAQSGLEFERRVDAAAIEAFYHLHLRSRQRLGIPVQPKGFFRRLHRKLIEPGRGFVGIVTRQGVVLAAAVFLEHRQTLTYKYGASRRDGLAYRPNECLFHHAIKHASEAGYTRLDFGSSRSRDEGLRRFKHKWGATETPLYHECLAGRPPDAVEDTRLARMAALTIRRSPVIVCRTVGETLYRYTP